jgi:hypothetical protein
MLGPQYGAVNLETELLAESKDRKTVKCPVCGYDIPLMKSGKMMNHAMDRSGKMSCIGSGKTPAEAKAAAKKMTAADVRRLSVGHYNHADQPGTPRLAEGMTEEHMLNLIEKKNPAANLGKHLKTKGSDADGDGKAGEKSVPPWLKKKKEEGVELDERATPGLAGGAQRAMLLQALKKKKEAEDKKRRGKKNEDRELDERTSPLAGGAARAMLLHNLKKKKEAEDEKKRGKNGKKMRKESLEAELERLESTSSSFPEIREQRIADVREELAQL